MLWRLLAPGALCSALERLLALPLGPSSLTLSSTWEARPPAIAWKNESDWEVICGERASVEQKVESSETSGANEKARNYGREKLADANWLGSC